MAMEQNMVKTMADMAMVNMASTANMVMEAMTND